MLLQRHRRDKHTNGATVKHKQLLKNLHLKLIYFNYIKSIHIEYSREISYYVNLYFEIENQDRLIIFCS